MGNHLGSMALKKLVGLTPPRGDGRGLKTQVGRGGGVEDTVQG